MVKSSKRSKALTTRELEIMQFIHEFGFCEINQIMLRFKMKRTMTFEQMRMLVRLEMINHAKVLPNQPRVYFLSAKAVKLLNTDLPTLTFVPLINFTHHMEVVRVFLKVHDRFPDSFWISERRLIREKYNNLRGSKEHVSDGILMMPDGRRIVIEVELSLKAHDRLLNIITDYVVDSAIHEVWYFCAPKIIPALSEISRDFEKVKIFSLHEELR